MDLKKRTFKSVIGWVCGIFFLGLLVLFISVSIQENGDDVTISTEFQEENIIEPQQTILEKEPEPKQEECVPDWKCTSWSLCSKNLIQTRSCEDVNQCGVPFEGLLEQECDRLPASVIQKAGLKVSYSNLYRYYEKYVEEIIYFEGRVFDVEEISKNNYILLVSVGSERDFYDEGTVWLNYAGDRVLEEDVIKFWGRMKGLKSYETVIGGENTVPELDVMHLEFIKKR